MVCVCVCVCVCMGKSFCTHRPRNNRSGPIDDPVADFINSATADVVSFCSTRSFEQFKVDIAKLNEMDSFPEVPN